MTGIITNKMLKKVFILINPPQLDFTDRNTGKKRTRIIFKIVLSHSTF